MSEADTEPSLLRDDSPAPEEAPVEDEKPARVDDERTLGGSGAEGRRGRIDTRAETTTAPAELRRSSAPTVHVVGFWKRMLASLIDLGVIVPSALIITWIVSKIAGVHLPPSNLRLRDIDGWIDLLLVSDPALTMGVGLLIAIGLIYALVFQIVLGRTLGMRVLRMKIIDVYGDSPSPARCAARCGGYLVGIATLFLGFLWIGFDSEKRGVQDWIAGTYVIRG